MPVQDEIVRLKLELQQLRARKERLEAKYKNAHDDLSSKFYTWKRATEGQIKALTDRLEHLTSEELEHLRKLEEELRNRQKQFDLEHGEIWKRHEDDPEVRKVEDEIKQKEGQLRLWNLKENLGIEVSCPMEIICGKPTGSNEDFDSSIQRGTWWHLPYWREKLYANRVSFIDGEVAIALEQLKSLFDARWFERQIKLEPEERHYVVRLLQGFDIVDGLIEMGIDLAIAKTVYDSAELIRRLRKTTEYFTLRFQLEILASLRRDFQNMHSEPAVPGGYADALISLDGEQVYFEITFLQPPFVLTNEIPKMGHAVRERIRRALIHRPWRVRVVLRSFPPSASHIQNLADELSKVDNLPHKLSWPWVEVDISRKRITEEVTKEVTVQVSGPPFSEGERIADRVVAKAAEQLPRDKPGFVIIRPAMPAINENELKEAIKEWGKGQPHPSLLGYLVVTEDIQQERRLILLYKNPYIDSRYYPVLNQVLSQWKYRLGSVAYSFFKDRVTPVQTIVSTGDAIFVERSLEP